MHYLIWDYNKFQIFIVSFQIKPSEQVLFCPNVHRPLKKFAAWEIMQDDTSIKSKFIAPKDPKTDYPTKYGSLAGTATENDSEKSMAVI